MAGNVENWLTMKIPASAFPQILKMVTQSLPYEVPFEPVTSEAKAVVSIASEFIRMDENLSDIKGFVYHLALNIDQNTVKQISTRAFLHRFVDILEAYSKDYLNEIK